MENNKLNQEEIKEEIKEEGGHWILNPFNHWEWVDDDDNTPHLNAFNHWE